MVICTQNSGLEPDNEQKMLASYSNLDYTELTTCGDFIHMEQSEMFNEKLKDFVLYQRSVHRYAAGTPRRVGGWGDCDYTIE